MGQASIDRVRNDVERDDFSRPGSREMSGDFPIPQTSDGADLISVEVRSKLRSFQKSPADQYRIAAPVRQTIIVASAMSIPSIGFSAAIEER